jgi:4-aminobutyrate--pyruvate transaminase
MDTPHLPNSAHARDIRYLIHPTTNLDKHLTQGPSIIRRGEGVYIYDDAGKRFLEGMAGLWSVSLGYGQKRLAEAAYRQMLELPYNQMFGHRSHDSAIDLAERLLNIAPKSLDKVLFSTSGSEANDQAIKLVWYYHNAIGKPRKKKIISRVRAYHGVTIYSASLTGLPNNHTDFDLPLGGVLRTDCPSHFHFGQAGESEADFVQRIAGNLENLILRENPDTIGAFIAEPVQGAGGVVIPAKGYFDAIQPILKRYGILLIADEVICGFGRTGSMFGSDTYAITPDIMTIAKALSSSYAPISGTMVSRQIFEAMVAESKKIGVFGHGFTYAGHPVSTAVALETLKIYEELDVVGMVRRISPHFLQRLHALRAHPLVGETRGVGLIGAVEVVRNKETREAFPATDNIALLASQNAHRLGLISRTVNNALCLCPPLIIAPGEVDEMFDIMLKALDEALATARERGLAG